MTTNRRSYSLSPNEQSRRNFPGGTIFSYTLRQLVFKQKKMSLRTENFAQWKMAFIDDYANKDGRLGGGGGVWILCSFYHERLRIWIKTNVKDVRSWKLFLNRRTWNFLHEILFPCRIQNLIKNGTLLGLFSFYWPILLWGFDCKSKETCKKHCLEVAPKNAKSKRLVFGKYILYLTLFKNKNRVTRLFFSN